jgi:hypothetical protein
MSVSAINPLPPRKQAPHAAKMCNIRDVNFLPLDSAMPDPPASFTASSASIGVLVFFCAFATDLAPTSFARPRAVVLAASRLSADHGVI